MVIELTVEDQSRLSAMAASRQRSEAELASEAMHWFLSATGSHEDALARSRKQVLQGKTIDHDELFREFRF